MTAQELDNELASMIGDDGCKVPGLGVIIISGGEEIFSAFHGRRDIAANKPVTRHTRFRIASVSKMFTVFTLMQLVESGKLNLDEDVSKYLGFELRNPNQPEKKITARMLASHTSSLRDGRIYSIPPTESIEEFFRQGGKYYESGAHFAEKRIGNLSENVGYFSYSNLNFGLLGTLIERVTCRRFDLWQRENILAQLETSADYVVGNLGSAAFKELGAIYRKKNPAGDWDEHGEWYGQVDDYGGEQPVAESVTLQNPYAEDFAGDFSLSGYRVGTNATIFSPQGGLRISFEELGHALRMLVSGGEYGGRRILGVDSVGEMMRAQWVFDGTNGDTVGGAMLSSGLGLYGIDGRSTARLCRSHAVDLVGHAGQAFGLLSGLFFVPQKSTGFVYAANGEAMAEGVDPRSCGEFSANFVWEERISDALCRFIVEQ